MSRPVLQARWLGRRGLKMKRSPSNNVLLIITIVLASACSNAKEAAKPSRDVASANWPVFRGDPSLAGVAEDGVPDKLSLLWSFPTESAIVSSPVMGGGRIYVGSTDGKVYCLDLADGRKIWEYDSGDDIEAPPLLLDGKVFIGNLSGKFLSLDAGSGKLLWEYKCRNSIYGSANWVKPPGKEETYVFVGCYDNRLYCFDAEKGTLIWLYETDNYINGAPATDGTHVIFGGCDELLHIISVSDGAKLGEVWAGSYIPGSAALVEQRAYLGHYDNKLVAIDIHEQRIVWEYADEDHPWPFFASPAVGETRVVIGSRDGYIHCVDRTSGRKLWDFQTRDEIDSSPVIAGDKVVAGSIDGRIYVLRLEDGKSLWSYEIGAAIIGCPAVAGGLVAIGAEDGVLYTFGEKP